MTQPINTITNKPYWRISWPLITLVLSMIWCLGSPALTEPDTFMHIAAGNWMFEHLAIPRLDPFTHSVANAPWIAHEWLSECAFAFVFNFAGWTGLVVLVSTCFSFTIVYLVRFLMKRVPPPYAILFAFMAMSAMVSHYTVRPHVLTWPIIAIWVGTLINASENKTHPPWLLLALMPLWVNLHGSFTMGLALILPFALEACLSLDEHTKIDWMLAKKWALFFLFALISGLANPYGLLGILFSYNLMQMNGLKYISEWIPMDFSKFGPFEAWVILILSLSLLGYLRLPLLRLIMVLGIFHQALAHSRFVSILGLLYPFLIATPFGKTYQQKSVEQKQLNPVDHYFNQLNQPAGIFSISVGIVIIGIAIMITHEYPGHTPPEDYAPSAALHAAKLAHVDGNVLNANKVGGYLIYEKVPVFDDGRVDMYGNAHIELVMDTLFKADPMKLKKLIHDYHIKWSILEPNSPPSWYLDQQPDWKKIYADNIAVVYVLKPAQ